MRGLLDPRSGGLLLLVAAIALLPLFLPNNFYYDVAIRTMINAFICVGLNLLVGYAGQISLGHAGFVGLGAYCSAILTDRLDVAPILALLAGAVLVGLLALVVARPILRLKGHYLAMATLGLGIIISIVINTEAHLTGGPDGMVVPSFTLFGVELYGERVWYWVVGGLLVAGVGITLNLIASPVGRALRSVHSSEVAAEVAGVHTTRFKVMVFVISAVFASIAGSVGAHYSGFVTPDEVGFFRSIELVTMVVLGGMASTYGALLGAILLTVLPEVLTGLEDYEHMAFGLVLMLTIIFMPRGLVPSLISGLRNLRDRRAEAAVP